MALLESNHWNHQSYPHKDFRSKVKTTEKVKNTSRMRPSPDTRDEFVRLLSFAKYPQEMRCSSILLARNGFMYTGKGTADDVTVMCVFCFSVGSRICDLKENHEIEAFHRKLNPNCSIVMGRKCGNKLIKESLKGSFEVIYHQLCRMRNKGSERTSPSLTNGNNSNTNTNLEEDSADQSERPQTPSEQQQPRGVSITSPIENFLSNTLQQPVEDGASSQIVTNFAESLHYPWQTRTSEPVDNLVNITSDSSSVPAAPHSNAPPRAPCNTISNRNDNFGNQPNRSDSSRPLEQNSVSSDSATVPDSVNARPDSQTSSRNTSTHNPNPNPNPQTTPQNSSSPQQAGNDTPDGATAYDKLGICTARPKRPEYAVEHVRLQSFQGWPNDHHIKPDTLAKAGYFYTGYSDCARCFFCGGGLRNWEEGDDVWVEHARWFQKCTFIRQHVGQNFIDVVQDLNKEREIIPYVDVIAEMEARGLEIVVPRDTMDKSPELKTDIAVRTVVDNGFAMADSIRAAEKVKEMGNALTSDLIFEELVKMDARLSSPRVSGDRTSGSKSTRGKSSLTQGTLVSLTNENNDLRQQSLCKICLDKEVAVVFLPCGHFVACRDCSYALKACPICRESIKGVVRGCLS